MRSISAMPFFSRSAFTGLADAITRIASPGRSAQGFRASIIEEIENKELRGGSKARRRGEFLNRKARNLRLRRAQQAGAPRPSKTKTEESAEPAPVTSPRLRGRRPPSQGHTSLPYL